MGFWGRLFGGGETPAQRLARAQGHLDDGEPRLAIMTIAKLDGPEVEALRQKAREAVEVMDREESVTVPKSVEPDEDDPLRTPDDPPIEQARAALQAAVGDSIRVTVAKADGSTTIASGNDVVVLNAPVSDDDGKPRSTDAIDVARRLFVATSAQPLDDRAFAFVDAACVLARAGEAMPELIDPKRRAIAELARVTTAGDVVERLRAAPELARFAIPLTARFAARELGALALDGGIAATGGLIMALLPIDPELVERILAREADAAFAAAMLLRAEAKGVALPAVAAKWDAWLAAAGDDPEWRARETQRLARRDLEAALTADSDPDADLVVATLLAAADPARALAMAREKDPHVDHAGWLGGLARARVPGAGALVDEWLAAFDPRTYDPYAYFVELVEACIAFGDVDRLRRTIATGGPTGWQIASAAYHSLAGAADRAPLLATCYERVPPGFVAGRAIGIGTMPVGAGKMVFQPAWLAFRDPHPIETLALPATLGPDGTIW